MTEIKDRFIGGLLGMALGDALGTTVEFSPRGSFQPLTDIIGGGPFKLEPGQFTDDTSMGICMAESLLEYGSFNSFGMCKKFLDWYENGHMSPTVECFDIGNATVSALCRCRKYIEKGGTDRNAYFGSTSPRSSGNGSLMRLVSVPLFFSDSHDEAVRISGESSRTTHGSTMCIDSCRYFASLIVQAVNGTSKEHLLSSPPANFSPALCKEVEEIAQGSFRVKKRSEIRSEGFVLYTLEAALWCLWNSENFKDGCLLAANLGFDADTTGAVYGQIAGVVYGASGIPKEWRDMCAMRPLLEYFGTALYEHVSGILPSPSDEFASVHGAFLAIERDMMTLRRHSAVGPHQVKSLEEFDRNLEGISNRVAEELLPAVTTERGQHILDGLWGYYRNFAVSVWREWLSRRLERKRS